MPDFKNQQREFEILEDAGVDRAQVVKRNKPFETTVEEFRFSHLKPARARAAGTGLVSDHYGAKGVNAERGQRDRRFVMSELTRDALSVSEEERRLIDEEVKKRVGELTEVAKAAGIERGHDEGLRRGHAEAFARFQAEAAERLGRFEALVAEMEGAKAGIFKQNEKFLIDLVYRICRGVLLRELKTDREYLVRLASELVEKTGLRENLVLRIHPKDAETAEMLKAGIEARLGALRNLKVETTEEVHLGGCALETEWGAIDASVETQLNQILAALSGGAAEG